MDKIDSLIEEGIYNFPLSLLSITDSKLIDKINAYLPYSTGFEIECNSKLYKNDGDLSGWSSNRKEGLNDPFKNIPNIIDVNCDTYEQRFRIPNGLEGLICLFNISQQLKLYSELNMGSGIHYHIDMTESYHLLNNINVKDNEKYILNELDTWEYKGGYNSRKIKFDCGHKWMRFQSSFKTAEIRIGEMTFDYPLLAKRIIHSNKIIKTLKDNIGNTIEPKYNKTDNKLLLDYHKNYNTKNPNNKLNDLEIQLRQLNEVEVINNIDNNMIKENMKKRIFKVNK